MLRIKTKTSATIIKELLTELFVKVSFQYEKTGGIDASVVFVVDGWWML